MKVKLLAATLEDASELHVLKAQSFMPLLEKYQDHDINPATEPLSKLLNQLSHEESTYLKIVANDMLVGAVRVVRIMDDHKCRISPIYVSPKFQGKGIAQAAFRQLEVLYGPKVDWELQTILEEHGNCHLYKKLGYSQLGSPRLIKENMHLVTYIKKAKSSEL